jgi:hypothetical protein
VKIYNQHGVLCETVISATTLSPGFYNRGVNVDKKLAAGVYFCAITTPKLSVVKKMAILK